MQKKLLFITLILILFGQRLSIAQTLHISQEKIEISVGDSIQISAIYTNENDQPIDVAIDWRVNPKKLGTIDDNGFFIAESRGKGSIYASFENLKASIKIEIIDAKGNDDNKNDLAQIVISPEELELIPGVSEQLNAIYINANGDTLDVEFNWIVTPGFLGTIDNTGFFTAEYLGSGKISAKYSGVMDEIKVKVETDNEDEPQDKEPGEPKVKIITKKISIAPQDSVQLVATYRDSTGSEIDTTFIWSVEPAALGHFDDPESGLFYADEAGKGKIIAAVGDLADTVKVEIEDEQEDEKPDGKNGNGSLTIAPKDTSVNVGDTVQFSAKEPGNKNGNATTVEWLMAGDPVGTLSADGVFSAEQAGVAIIKAKTEKHYGTTIITVIDPSAIDEKINAATIYRVLPDGHILPPKIIKEGNVYVIGGMPFPLDILNGGRLYFPHASLHEDINIHILLPENIDVDSAGVSTTDGSVAGVRFEVSVGDSAISPYYFDTPLNLAIPYKRALLDSLGIDPLNLGLFFAENDEFSDIGISNVTVDSLENRIYAQVIHFTTLVVRESSSTGLKNNINLPDTYLLKQNYPNPFNPSTTICYQLQQDSRVQIKVYDSLGRLITTLVDHKHSQGVHQTIWNGRNADGHQVASGVYYYSLRVNGKNIQTNKMLLIK